MREILFRAKHYKTKQWVYGIPFRNPVNGLDNDAYHPQIIPEINKMHSTIDSCSVIEETISQYTGLIDKNGTKIFEGDIVRYNDTIHKVIFCTINGSAFFGITMPDRGEIWNFDGITCANKMEVIGNIHDNPELLGGADDECKKV